MAEQVNLRTPLSAVRQHWMPTEQAIEQYLAYEERYGRSHALLACHAAFPLIVTPELVNLIGLNFLSDQAIDWVAEADFLLAFCHPIDTSEGLYQIDPGLREVMLADLQESDYGIKRLYELADFLLAYGERYAERQRRPDIARIHQWIALSYLYPQKVVDDMRSVLLAERTRGIDTIQSSTDQIHVATMIEVMRDTFEIGPLSQEEQYQELLETAQIVAHYWYRSIIPYAHDAKDDFSEVDSVANDNMLISYSASAYIKRMKAETSLAQGRGGRGIKGIATRAEDEVINLLFALNLDSILFFTNKGRVYCNKVYELPEGSRTARGAHIVNLLNLQPDETVSTMLIVPDFEQAEYITLITRQARIKRMELSVFNNVRSTGLLAMNLGPGDSLDWARLTNGNEEFIIVTRNGKALRFHEDNARTMGRTAAGVMAMRLLDGDEVVSMDVVKEGYDLFVIHEKGWGKRVPLEEYNAKGRYTQGMWTTDHNRLEEIGAIVAARVVHPRDQIRILTSQGNVLGTEARSISQMGRATRGVRIVKMLTKDSIAAITVIAYEDARRVVVNAGRKVDDIQFSDKDEHDLNHKLANAVDRQDGDFVESDRKPTMNELTALRATLANLYPTQADARRVVADAGLDPAHIEFSDKAINNWHNILTEAEKRGSMTALIEIAGNEYGTNSNLIAAVQAYGSAQNKPLTHSKSRPTTVYNIHTGGDIYLSGNVNTGGDDFVGRDLATTQEKYRKFLQEEILSDDADGRELLGITQSIEKLLNTHNLVMSPTVELPERPKEPKRKGTWDALEKFKPIVRYGWLYHQCKDEKRCEAVVGVAMYQLDDILKYAEKIPQTEREMIKKLTELWRREFYQGTAVRSPQEMKPENPFIFLEPLRGRLPFVGRKAELKALKQAGSRGSLQPVLLSGLVHSGKSSLIHKAMFEYNDDICFVLFNIPGPGGGVFSPKHIYDAMHQSLQRRLQLKLTDEEITNFQTDPAAATEKLVRDICYRFKVTLVLVVGNVDQLTGASAQPILQDARLTNRIAIANSLFEYWWHLMQSIGNLSFVFVSYRTALPGTPFTPFLKKIQVGNLEIKEVLELLTTPTADFTPLFAPEAVEYIYTLTGGQPFLVQLIAHCVTDRFNQVLDKDDKLDPVFLINDVDSILKDETFSQFNQFYFQKLRDQLESLQPGSNALLRTIAHYVDGITADELEQVLIRSYGWVEIEVILDFLETQQMIKRVEGRYLVVGELLRRDAA